jgi:alanyl-tRNA synthetase
MPFLAQTLSGVSGKDLAGLIDAHKDRMSSGAVLLIADTGGKAAVAAGVTADLTDKVSAVDLVRAAVENSAARAAAAGPISRRAAARTSPTHAGGHRRRRSHSEGSLRPCPVPTGSPM